MKELSKRETKESEEIKKPRISVWKKAKNQ
jgi:hypothetical protein